MPGCWQVPITRCSCLSDAIALARQLHLNATMSETCRVNFAMGCPLREAGAIELHRLLRTPRDHEHFPLASEYPQLVLHHHLQPLLTSKSSKSNVSRAGHRH
ncbi:hypothetical protein LIA77_10346 [Sarocladium implicatum]|nr:hypothetical protein LIA77_10346 [Sarocladium implicatum]